MELAFTEGCIQSCNLRRLLSIYLMAVMIGPPGLLSAAVSGEKPVGFVAQATSAWLGSATLVAGATVYPGDTLKTEADGLVRLGSGASQLYLLPNSKSKLLKSTDGLQAELLVGSAEFNSEPSSLVVLMACAVTVAARPGSSARGRVSISGENEIVVASLRGTFDVSIDGDTHSVEDGKSYKVEIVDDSQQGSGTIPAVRSRRKLVLRILEIGAIVGTGVGAYFLYRELNESPSAPSHQ